MTIDLASGGAVAGKKRGWEEVGGAGGKEGNAKKRWKKGKKVSISKDIA